MSLAAYEAVLGLLREQIVAIEPGDRDRATPCSEWDTTKLVSHVASAIEYYGRLSTGAADVRPVRIEFGSDDDLVAEFDAAAADGLAEWSAPGTLDHEVHMMLGAMPARSSLAIHVADLTVHVWDLARARGSDVELPEDLATSTLATWQSVCAHHDLHGLAFDAEVMVGPDASPTARLVAYCGRTP
jgi:uncharacterized protein (TIGR03086 family)